MILISLLGLNSPHLPTPTWCTQAPPHSTISIPEPGDVLVQFRTELYYGYSSRRPWVPDAARESWGSRDGPNSLQEEQRAKSGWSLSPTKTISGSPEAAQQRVPHPSWRAKPPARKQANENGLRQRILLLLAHPSLRLEGRYYYLDTSIKDLCFPLLKQGGPWDCGQRPEWFPWSTFWPLSADVVSNTISYHPPDSERMRGCTLPTWPVRDKGISTFEDLWCLFPGKRELRLWQSFQGGVAVSVCTCECPVPFVQPQRIQLYTTSLASRILSSLGSLFLGMLSLP